MNRHSAGFDRDNRSFAPKRQDRFKKGFVKRAWTRSYPHMACDGSCDLVHDGDNDDNKRQQEESEDSSAEEAASLRVSCGPDADFKD